MIEIRELRAGDLPGVASLWDLVEHEGTGRTPASRLIEFLQQTLLESPWLDPELPSLVASDGQEIVGFLGSNVRRMRFEDRPVRMACSAHLLAHPRARAQAVGARLLHTYLDGPQDLTITDGATEPMRKMWEGLGGTTVHASCLSFAQALKPGRLAIHRLGRSSRLKPIGLALRPVAGLVDRVGEPLRLHGRSTRPGGDERVVDSRAARRAASVAGRRRPARARRTTSAI